MTDAFRLPVVCVHNRSAPLRSLESKPLTRRSGSETTPDSGGEGTVGCTRQLAAQGSLYRVLPDTDDDGSVDDGRDCQVDDALPLAPRAMDGLD